MNAPVKITTMSSREFNQNTSRAKLAAKDGPVYITDHGKPAHVLLTVEEYERLKTVAKPKGLSLMEALADPNPDPDPNFNFNDYLPKREIEPMRFSFDEDE